MPRNTKRAKQYIQFTVAGVQLVIFTLFFVFGGIFLDTKFGTKPYLLLVCTLVGIGGGLWYIIKRFIQIK